MEQQFKEWVKKMLDKCPYHTPSVLASRYQYVADTKGWRFDDMKSVAEKVKQVYFTHKEKS